MRTASDIYEAYFEGWLKSDEDRAHCMRVIGIIQRDAAVPDGYVAVPQNWITESDKAMLAARPKVGEGK